MNNYIFTCGDINGIGPEIVIKALNKISADTKSKFYFICPVNIFLNAIESVIPDFSFEISQKYIETDARVSVIALKDVKQSAGVPTKRSGKCSYDAIVKSYDLIKKGKADAVITAPISKTAFKLAGIKYPGHTELYASLSESKYYVMTFLSQKFKAALVTIHEPLKNVPGLLTKKRLKNSFRVIINSLKQDFGISNPKIAVLGLNPHSGENGLLGKEEKKTILPVIDDPEFKQYLSGPYSSDAFFGNQKQNEFDMVLGMYHDQVLIPFKLLNFNSGVNYTAGLPIIRTSPDHGTAYDIAGKNTANEDSIVEAFYWAEKIVSSRKRETN